MIFQEAFLIHLWSRFQPHYLLWLCAAWHMTLTNPLASSRYAQAMNSALAQGHGYDEASQLAANNFYSTLQQQSLLLGIKTVIGYLLIAALVIAVVSAFIPFHKTLKVAVVKTGDDMV